jgi:hypothetical protein
MGDSVPGIDSIDNLVGKRAFSEPGTGCQQIFENESTERNRMGVAPRVIIVDPSVFWVFVFMRGQPRSELLRSTHAGLPWLVKGA